MLDRIKRDELVRGSFILFVMIGFYNVFNYAFQVSMAKMLMPENYGILAVLMSFIYIFSIPSEAIQTFISRYTSKFNVKKQHGKIKDMFYKSINRAVKFSLILFISFLVLSIYLKNILKIDFFLLALTGVFIFSAFLIPIGRGILQGRKEFFALGFNLISEGAIKFVFAIVLVLLGWKVYGSMIGVLIAEIAVFAMFFIFLRNVLKSRREKGEFKGIYLDSMKSIIAIASIVLIYSIDIIIARVVFPAKEAGIYAFVSLIGKVIFFSSSAIGKAMLPIASESFENGKNTQRILKKSILLVLLISIIALFFYLFFPEVVIKLLSLGTEEYLSGSNILFILGLAFSFTSLSYILLLYKISINKLSKKIYLILLFVIIEAIALSIFNASLFQFAISLLIVNIVMFLYAVFVE